MNIDGSGLTLDELNDILTAFEISLKEKYGDDFYIKAEGVIDNIFTTIAFQELTRQEQIAFLRKQFDPESAEDEWQDALYERILCYRIKAEKTVAERTVVGTAGLNVAAGEIIIRNKATLDEYENKACTVGIDGTVVADFECVLFGPIALPDESIIEIVKIPLGVTDVTLGTTPKVDVGRDRETDEEYRVRFRKSKSLNARSSRNANISNLSSFVDDLSYITVKDKKSDISMTAGTIKIIANHNTTDAIFAKAIFETVADGPDLVGDDSIIVKDDANQDVTIKWTNADFVEVAIKADVKKKSGVLWETLEAAVKASIISYIHARAYGLKQTVYATEFVIPAFQTEGLETAINFKVSVNGSETWVDSLDMAEDNLAAFSADWITLNEIV